MKEQKEPVLLLFLVQAASVCREEMIVWHKWSFWSCSGELLIHSSTRAERVHFYYQLGDLKKPHHSLSAGFAPKQILY